MKVTIVNLETMQIVADMEMDAIVPEVHDIIAMFDKHYMVAQRCFITEEVPDLLGAKNGKKLKVVLQLACKPITLVSETEGN